MNIVRLLKLKYINDELDNDYLDDKFPILYRLLFNLKYYHDDSEQFKNHERRTPLIVYYLDNRDNWIFIHNVKHSDFNVKINNIVIHYELITPMYQQYYMFNKYERVDYMDMISRDVYEFVSYLTK